MNAPVADLVPLESERHVVSTDIAAMVAMLRREAGYSGREEGEVAQILREATMIESLAKERSALGQTVADQSALIDEWRTNSDKHRSRAEAAERRAADLEAKAQVMHDLHSALGVAWGSDPYARITELLAGAVINAPAPPADDLVLAAPGVYLSPEVAKMADACPPVSPDGAPADDLVRRLNANANYLCTETSHCPDMSICAEAADALVAREQRIAALEAERKWLREVIELRADQRDAKIVELQTDLTATQRDYQVARDAQAKMAKDYPALAVLWKVANAVIAAQDAP